MLPEKHSGRFCPKDIRNGRTLNKAEENYSTIEKELLAIVWAVRHFRTYIYGVRFYIITDHKPLVWLMNLKDSGSRLMRWRIKLEEHDYEIVYKKGSANTNADALSRFYHITGDDTYQNFKDSLSNSIVINDNVKEFNEDFSFVDKKSVCIDSPQNFNSDSVFFNNFKSHFNRINELIAQGKQVRDVHMLIIIIAILYFI